MNEVDRTRPPTAARAIATLAAAVPCAGLGTASLWQSAFEPAEYTLDRAFHLGLALLLLAVFLEFAVSIWRSPRALTALLLGVAGLLASLAAAVVTEIFGPPALLVLLGVAGAGAFALAVTGSRYRTWERARAPEAPPCR